MNLEKSENALWEWWPGGRYYVWAESDHCGQLEFCHKFDVLPIEQTAVQDTTGAGDAFCGGFLASIYNSPLTKGQYLVVILPKNLKFRRYNFKNFSPSSTES